MVGEAAEVGKVAPRGVDVEQVDDLNLFAAADGISPVGVQDLADCAVFVRRGKSAVASLLAEQAHRSAIKREQSHACLSYAERKQII